jgi:hypothetical protein
MFPETHITVGFLHIIYNCFVTLCSQRMSLEMSERRNSIDQPVLDSALE